MEAGSAFCFETTSLFSHFCKTDSRFWCRLWSPTQRIQKLVSFLILFASRFQNPCSLGFQTYSGRGRASLQTWSCSAGLKRSLQSDLADFCDFETRQNAWKSGGFASEIQEFLIWSDTGHPEAQSDVCSGRIPTPETRQRRGQQINFCNQMPQSKRNASFQFNRSRQNRLNVISPYQNVN